MSTIVDFTRLLLARGSNAVFHRDVSALMVQCPCVTPLGYRDPEYHLENPTAPVCDEDGLLPSGTGSVINISVKAFVQPIQSTRATRLNTEMIQQIFGEVQGDDHLGIFPCEWNGTVIDFYVWSLSGADYVEYNNRRFTVVNANLIPDPSDGNPRHHWEVGLRLISNG